MTNLKKMALGLLVAVLAVGFSAFTSAKQIQQAKFVNYYYGWDGIEYRLIGTMPELQNCVAGDQVCVKTLDTEDTPPATISLQDAENLPSPPGAEDESQFDFSN